jgi:hypothetical protein
MRVHGVWAYIRWTERWELIAEYTSGMKDAIECAQAYRRQHATTDLKLTFPGGTYTVWPA